MSYTDQATIESFVKRALTADEEVILPLILDTVDEYINEQVGGEFGPVVETSRYFDGGSKILEIDTCHEISAVEDTGSEDYIIYSYTGSIDYDARPINEEYKTYLHKRGGKFPSGVANMKVTAKFTENETVPNDIIYLATYLAGQLFSKNIVGNYKSESIEGYSRTFADMIEENQVLKMVLDKYSNDDILI